MDFFTHIQIQKAIAGISYRDSLMLFGSCFAESMGVRLMECKFRADVNPFGVLYNPSSILSAIARLLDPKEVRAEELFFRDGLYHSYAYHSRFSTPSESECLRRMNERLQLSAAHLQQTDWILVTFGTAYVYRLNETEQVVANCHKAPDKLFRRERLSVTRIVEEWEALLSLLWRRNREVRVMFTVSPVRHWKDGAHANQLSKSVLLLAIEQLQARYPGQILYFPAYELMMDELRDYRFYADDLLHPSDRAIRYIWDRFTATCMDPPTQEWKTRIEDVLKALNHIPQNPQGDLYKQFVMQTIFKMEQLQTKLPYLCFEKEIEQLKKQAALD